MGKIEGRELEHTCQLSCISSLPELNRWVWPGNVAGLFYNEICMCIKCAPSTWMTTTLATNTGAWFSFPPDILALLKAGENLKEPQEDTPGTGGFALDN